MVQVIFSPVVNFKGSYLSTFLSNLLGALRSSHLSQSVQMTWNPCQPMDADSQLFACVLNISFKVNKVSKWQRTEKNCAPVPYERTVSQQISATPTPLLHLPFQWRSFSSLSKCYLSKIAVWNSLNPLLGLKSFLMCCHWLPPSLASSPIQTHTLFSVACPLSRANLQTDVEETIHIKGGSSAAFLDGMTAGRKRLTTRSDRHQREHVSFSV